MRFLPDRTYTDGSGVSLVVRPESLRLGPPDEKLLSGMVQLRTFVGDRLEYEVSLPDGNILHVEEPYMVGMPMYNEGDRIGVIVSPADIVALPD